MAGDTDTIASESETDDIMSTGTAKPAVAILEALQSGGDPSKSLFSALAGEAGSSPQFDMLMKLMSDQGESQADRLRAEIREELAAEQADAVNHLSETTKRLFAEREAAQLRIEGLAAALGACPICFGDDLLCDTCRGQGVPGGRAPEPAAFRRYVGPAVDRVRTALQRSTVRRPWAPPASADPRTAAAPSATSTPRE
jgi:hypothetical protein